MFSMRSSGTSGRRAGRRRAALGSLGAARVRRAGEGSENSSDVAVSLMAMVGFSAAAAELRHADRPLRGHWGRDAQDRAAVGAGVVRS